MLDFFTKYKQKRLYNRVKQLYDRRDRGEHIDIKYEIQALKTLAAFYEKHQYNKTFPHAKYYAQEYYRAAAGLGDPEAQYIFAQKQLEAGKFWEQLSGEAYGNEVHRNYAKSSYDEAIENIKKAENSGYALAKRLHGMMYIHGWGVEKNQDEGFRLVIESIEEEGSWDRATHIFEELGLNKPEFFQAIMAAKQKH